MRYATCLILFLIGCTTSEKPVTIPAGEKDYCERNPETALCEAYLDESSTK
jgi:hypothetical protein